LPNRVLLDDRLTQAMAHADRDGRAFALMVCDLDRFKLVNDSLGHGAGDELLQEVSAACRDWCARPIPWRASAAMSSCMLITSIQQPTTRRGLAIRAVEEVLQAPVRIAQVDVHTSPSIGIAFYPQDGKTIEALIAHADAAMYCAKQRGRGCVQCFEGDMSAGLDNRVQLESDLHQAIALKQFELYYQPKVHTNTGAVRSAEALIRWVHPERGVITPDAFIPLAEDCGLIGAIGEWVVQEACRQARAWRLAGLAPMRVSVNLSPSQFRGSGLIHTIRRALDDAGLEPQYLEVELTESAVMSDPEESIAILEQLSAMGVLVSVDDFGTGYSSMSYLRRLPIDKLKIDRVFINEIVSRPEDASIVRAIVSLAHSLRLKVVAEGVETPAQLDFLKAVGAMNTRVFISAARCLRASSSGSCAKRRKPTRSLRKTRTARTASSRRTGESSACRRRLLLSARTI
jgi:diguanylate cyclase (GGDEF)-like protein